MNTTKNTMTEIKITKNLSELDQGVVKTLCHKDEQGKWYWDFQKCLQILEARGKRLYSPSFRIIQEDHAILYKLFAYALRDEHTAAKYGLDLRKGLFLIGPVGCGKTSLMNLLRDIYPRHLSYKVIPCSQLSFDFPSKGFDVINRYSNHSFKESPHQDIPQVYCFDDLGTEPLAMHYGMPCNVMTEVLIMRHRYFHNAGMLTHVTTNLTVSEIEERYGTRLRSRLREAYNQIAWDHTAADKRR